MTPLVDAMEQWKAAQSQLVDAINTFHDACATLEAAADWTRRALGDYTSAEAVIQEVTACLPNITSHRRHLYSAELGLCRMFNSSTNLVPINKLPPEIFCRTLSLAIRSSDCIVDELIIAHKYKDDGYKSRDDVDLGILAVLQLVCSRWRHLVISTPSLWSHVDVLGLHPSTGEDARISKLTQMQLERAAGTPICLHFHQSVHEHPDLRVALSLRSYLHSVYSIIFSQWSEELLVRTISEVCSSDNPPDLIPVNIPRNDLPKAIHLDWPKRTFYGITDLRIGYIGYQCNSYYLDHLLAMLSSNPLIRILRVHEMPSYLGSDVRSPALISLPHLELLELGTREQINYSLLSNLEPGTVGLDLRLEAPRTDEDLIAVQSFSERSRIKSLTLKTVFGSRLEYLHPCISSMPLLGTLFLDAPFSMLRVQEFVESVLLTGDVPHLYRLPNDDYIWKCAASFPNLNIIGLAPDSGWDDRSVLQLAPLVAAYSLDLLVLLARSDEPCDPPCDPKIWSWVSKRVKSTALVRKNPNYGDPHDPWDLFMETLRLG